MTSSIIYRRLTKELAGLLLTKHQIAEKIGISYSSLHNKLCGLTEFTLSEAIIIKKMLNFDGSLEELFLVVR